MKKILNMMAFLLAMVVCEASLALTPPRPGEMDQYRQDGTLSQRQARAERLGNHHFDPQLIFHMRQKMAAAQGLTLPNFTPPSNWTGGLPATGSPKVVVILIDFPDCPSTGGTGLCPSAVSSTLSDVTAKYFGDGSSADAPYESLRNFYQRSSYNTLTIGGNVLGWYRASHNRSYYEGLGDNSGNEALVMEAMNYFAGQGHDFAQYDNDGNGTLDAVYIKWTGPDNGWSNFWWAYQTGWYINPSYTVSGKHVGKFIWSWIENPSQENGQTGYHPSTDIHETGHILGLPDYYDYDDTVGPKGGLGGLDVMDSVWGDHNAFSKAMLGWLTPTLVSSGTQALTLNPTGTSPNAVLVASGTTGNIFGDFFMAQYRKRGMGNDPSTFPTDGLVIWHVNAALNADGSDFLNDNSYTSHKLLRLMEADGLEEIENGQSANAGDFYISPKTFTPSTLPNSNLYDAASSSFTATVPSNIYITSISAGGASTMNATFSIGGGTTTNYTLTVNPTGSGTVTSSPSGINCGSSCSASFASGTSVALTAAPASGYTFSGWGGDCSGTGSCSVSMTAAKTVSATFTASTSTFTLTVNKTGSGTVTSNPAGISCGGTCSASFASGTSVALTAAPASGYTFSGWGGDCSGSDSCQVTMNAAKAVTAIFASSGGGSYNDVILIQATSPSTLGAGPGDDTYILTPYLLKGTESITLSDAQGTNLLQLVGGLSITKSDVAATALRLTLTNGATVTVLGANAFQYDVGGNATAGINHTPVTFAVFAQSTLGVAVPSGSSTVTGGPVTIP
ncbi:immune inhibitor A [Gammaproteobacteria bacterium]